MATWSILARAIGSTVRISFPTVVEALRGTLKREACDARLDAWSRELLEAARIELVVIGREHVDPNATYVVLSNHQSLYDIPALYQALPLRLRMAAKRELFRVPLWGAAMLAAEFVPIDRARGADARAALLEAGRKARELGVSLWVAPEGTRSPTGVLGAFKTGAFSLARAAGLPLLPVTIRGTRDVLGKDGRTIHTGQRVTVVIHEPIAFDEMPENAPDLVELVRARIASALSP